MKYPRRHIPRGATPVTTYDDLIEYAQMFATGKLGLLVVIGNPGVGKSETFKAAFTAYIQEEVTTFLGQASS